MAVEGIIANGVTQILKKLSFIVANEITLVWDFNDELKNLQSTLNMILAVMEDAEKKQVSSKAVGDWMEKLKAIAYDAEDILDEYAYEVILCKFKKEDKSTTFNKVRSVFSSSTPSFVCSWILAHKVKEINALKLQKLRTPLLVGAQGSKILVTTRSTEVAKIMMDKFPPYPLGILKENDCWSLFKELTFGYVDGPEETSNFVEIGKEMVNRCKGLPLAVIFLGRLMRSKKKEEEWKIIRDTKLWHESRLGEKSKNEILPSLRLSYDNLPSHLKQCFSYCCLFPKDLKIERETLIRLWMAEGFLIQSPGENTITMEEIGNEYFLNLLYNFFFQDAMKNVDGDVKTCKMHDLVHDLALSVVGNKEYLIIKNTHDIKHMSEATRRLSLVNLDGDMLPKFLETLKNAKNLRTVFVIGKTIGFDIGNAFKKNKRLRVLNLSDSVIEESTSSSIGEFKHLRYLHAYEAGSLLFPKGIGRLNFLQTLSYFQVGNKKKNKNANVIQELGGLNLLGGDLIIDNLENVTSKTDAYRANLKERNNLRGLRLRWNGEYSKDASVMEGLLPHPNLRLLEIRGFKGSKFPRWMEDSSCLPNLVTLHLWHGRYEQLAGFGALPSLKSLTVLGIKDLECIGNEFYYSAGSSSSPPATTTSFPSLKKLTLYFMDSLKEWVVPSPSTTTCCFPLLEEITIYYCPLLTTITPTTTIFPSLKLLELHRMDGRAAKLMVMNNLNTLTSLSLYDIPNLISFPRQGLTENDNTLLSLKIINCPNFKGFLLSYMEEDQIDDDDQGGAGGVGGGQQLQVSQLSSTSSSLHSLELYDCPVLSNRFIPDISSLTSLRELEIQDCNASKSLQDQLTCLSSSSSLECMEFVKILKCRTAEEIGKKRINDEVIFEWRKSSFY